MESQELFQCLFEQFKHAGILMRKLKGQPANSTSIMFHNMYLHHRMYIPNILAVQSCWCYTLIGTVCTTELYVCVCVCACVCVYVCACIYVDVVSCLNKGYCGTSTIIIIVRVSFLQRLKIHTLSIIVVPLYWEMVLYTECSLSERFHCNNRIT